nr:NADH dehydrogenase subunit 2 [Pholas orientalis]
MSWSRMGPSSGAFFLCNVGGLYLVLMSSSLMSVWVGLEIMFLSVLPLISGDTWEENDSCMKYFVFQSMSSCILFCSFVSVSLASNLIYFSWILFLVGLSLKLGLFPFHYWVPSVMAFTSWFGCFLVSVWQKIGPIWLLGSCGFGSSAYLFLSLDVLALVTVLIGGIGGIGVVQYRSLIGYSSLVNTSWMVVVSMLSLKVAMLYVIFYGVVSSVLFIRLYWMKLYTFVDLSAVSPLKVNSLLFIAMDFFSLAGLPPFIGAIPKIVSVYALIFFNCYYSLSILLLGSMIMLFNYMSIISAVSVGMGCNWLAFSKMSMDNGGLLNSAKASNFSESFVFWLFSVLVGCLGFFFLGLMF